MKLSIITTVYQAGKDLPRLLDSMMAQKSPELEYFLIDNGCTDSSAAICESYAKKDSRFRIHTLKDNIGYIRARNLGLEIVDADYVGFCDSDDYLIPGAYDKIITCIEKSDCDLYIGNWNTVTENGEIRLNRLPFASGTYSNKERRSEIAPFFYGPTSSGSMLQAFMWKQVIRLSVIKETGLRFKESLKPWEDMLLNAKLFNACKKVVADNDNVIYNYIISNNSITGKLQANVDIENESDRIITLYKDLKEIAPDEDCRIANANRTLQNLITLISKTSRSNYENQAKRLSECLPTEFTYDVVQESSPWAIEYKLLKQLIRLRLFGIMLNLFKLFH